jgi:hypothetical protein
MRIITHRDFVPADDRLEHRQSTYYHIPSDGTGDVLIMSTLYGDKNRFAIEWNLASNHGGGWLFGNICFWIGGELVGDYSTCESLSELIPELKYPVGDCGNRRSQRFCQMPADDAFKLIYRAFFDMDFVTPEELELESWARFDVSLGTDSFDDWKLYLFDCASYSRLLIGRRSDAGFFEFLREQQLEVGEYDAAIRALQIELMALWDREDGRLD